ncbi:hypothetical protein GCM10027160_29010 [Streptomyces calidiresistens]|uniref:Uncharacterized protein n=1 Tax=Streptomyces calidiresistens TaxID=1485586 RepID=A0A7W3XV95_9ACTN|nr:hypothetical protein [Streptomyces calidiresistens]MBB0228519.1 hypothetical protein [Streptomyces calidiresistens]
MNDRIRIERRWCLTADRTRVVPEEDPEARYLHWRPGQLVPRAEAVRLGALETVKEDQDQEQGSQSEEVKPEPAKPAGRKPAAKRRSPRSNKAATAESDKTPDADGDSDGRW